MDKRLLVRCSLSIKRYPSHLPLSIVSSASFFLESGRLMDAYMHNTIQEREVHLFPCAFKTFSWKIKFDSSCRQHCFTHELWNVSSVNHNFNVICVYLDTSNSNWIFPIFWFICRSEHYNLFNFMFYKMFDL